MGEVKNNQGKFWEKWALDDSLVGILLEKTNRWVCAGSTQG